MTYETVVTVWDGNCSYAVKGDYDRESGEFGIASIIGDVTEYLPSDKFEHFAALAQVEADKQEAERRIEEAAYRGSVER